MLNVIIQSVDFLFIVMLSVVELSVVMLSVVMLSFIMLSVVMLSVVMLSAVTPIFFSTFKDNYCMFAYNRLKIIVR
jgi:hypothetical protein